MTTKSDRLIRELDQQDPRARSQAEDRLLELGDEVREPLVRALGDKALRRRRSAARLLGRLSPTRAGLRALCGALTDEDPKVRKLAGTSLGRLESRQSVAPILSALAKEELGWVRASYVLALGALGGEQAFESLSAMVEPEDPREAVALRKALDKLAPSTDSTVTWRRDATWRWTTQLDAPRGLEAVAQGEAAAKGWAAITAAGPGRLKVPAAVPPWEIAGALRCVHSLRIPLKAGPPINPRQIDGAAVKEWLGSQPRLRALGKWLCFEGPVRYRLAVVGAEAPLRLPKPILGAARAALGPMGLLDSPSRYDLELQIRLERGGASLTLRPCFEEDKRFDYRERDVGASINPVIGACLARLVFTGEGAAVRDPTCGSGTLLIERGLMDPAAGLVGVDISPTAVAASRHNATVVGMDDRIKLLKGDAGAARSWKPCDEVVANLPFGVRTRKKDTDLAALYSSVCRHLEANLSREGRAVLYTGAHRTLEQALRGARGLRVRDKFRTRAGGLDVSIFVVQNPGSR